MTTTPEQQTRAGSDDHPVDLLGRPLRDLRISVTDRCNFRCSYCMPREVFGPDYAFLPRSEILTFEEITRVARISAGLGVTKFRLTGGEPLLRSGLPDLIRMLSQLPDVDIALTTNGSLLAAHAPALVDAGLRRITVSLDSLDDDVFRAMNDAGFGVSTVLEGIAAASAVGLPVKINAVVRRGLNEHTIVDLARWARAQGHIVRFIEYMDVGHSNGWRLDDVVPGEEIVRRISSEMRLESADPNYPGEVARRWRYVDAEDATKPRLGLVSADATDEEVQAFLDYLNGEPAPRGEIGVITSVTQPFCGDCTRARLSADGHLYTCLFATQGTDLRAQLRSDATDHDLTALLRTIWLRREDRYSELRSKNTIPLEKVEMSYIGG